MLEARSIVQWYEREDKQKCGYCKSPENGSIMFGMWAHCLTVEDYQALIDRGWRRSGQYCYKSVMHETCCPLYTIRCHALEFRPTKSQKKVMKKMSKFLKTGILKERERKELLEDDDNEVCEVRIAVKECPSSNMNIEELTHRGNLDILEENEYIDRLDDVPVTTSTVQSKEVSGNNLNIRKEEKLSISKQRAVKKGLGPDPSRPPCKKAKTIRYENKMKKIENSGQTVDNKASKSEGKSLEEFLDVSDEDKHKLTLKLIQPSDPCSEWSKYEQLEFDLYKKYQNIIHNDPPHKNTLQGFLRFLVNTPLVAQPHPEHKKDSKVPPYGSFHQQYWLDDKLIAVGVIDILPKCVSAVYFFYDPDYRELTLGTYGSLREIQLTRELYPTLATHYYYMGFYVHSCQKMRYKGNMHPSDLLCPETYQWCQIEKCLDSLNITKYCRFNDDQSAIDSDECSANDLDKLRLISDQKLMTYRTFKKSLRNDDMYKNIGRLVGKKAIKSLIFIEE